MPLLLGIDEAGYGPNLGPFVMSSALFQVPDGQDHDLWKPLRSVIRKARHKADGRLLVDDSKQVYSPKLGIGVLQKNLWPFLRLLSDSPPTTLDCLYQQFISVSRTELDQERYLIWDQPCAETRDGEARMVLLRTVLESKGIALKGMESQLIMPQRFNHMVKAADSKAAVPLHCVGQLIELLKAMSNENEKVAVVVDRLGGRSHYLSHIETWFPGYHVKIVEETGRISRYQIGEWIEMSFVVEADGQSLPVALASMFSKYLRELCMSHFNAWFQCHQPAIAPTAGYPLDSHRFWRDVEPTRRKLGLVEPEWWRER